MVEIASVVLCMKLLSAPQLLQEWSPHQVAKSLMPLMTFVLILPCQQWIRHLGRSVLETGRPTDFHSGFALAWGGVWETLGAAPEAYGKWHDRVLREEVRVRTSEAGAHWGRHLSLSRYQCCALPFSITPTVIYSWPQLSTGWVEGHLLAVNCGLPKQGFVCWDSGECLFTIRQ